MIILFKEDSLILEDGQSSINLEQFLEEPVSCSNQISCTAKVERVVDGDTIVLESGERVRYIGIDTPEMTGPKRKTAECFGEEATKKNRELIEGKKVRLEKDISEVDKYQRLLRYVYLEDIFVNDYLIRNGYASAVSFPPDIKYQEQFRVAEQEAKKEARGFWGKGICDIK
ncbi:MAG: thermonuclease family protein [Patescibacteria group bacterium]|nr:thermonuclease family protein [Patescibacteria group bacterium]